MRIRQMTRGCTVVVAAGLLSSCGPTHTSATTDGEPGSSDANFPDAASCGAQMQNIGVVNLGDPPDMLVVLDRSGSMSGPPPTFPPTFVTKWSSMKTSLSAVVTAKQQQIKFGLLEFPSDDNCAATATPKVSIALGSGPNFSNYFANRSPNGNTPAHIALNESLTYYNSIPVNPAGRFVLFATDGEPNCLGADPAAASNAETVAAVTALKAAGIKTFVLGFGSFAGAGGGVLNDAAVAGGVPKAGSKKYYEATSAAELSAALNQIAGGIIVPSCSFQLQSVPPVPGDVSVKLNGVLVPRSPSHANGWDYSPNAMTITFFGSFCSQIKMAASSNVSFVYGCPGPVIE
jgi:hypothetical protein